MRSMECETRNQKYGTRNQKYGTRNKEPEIWKGWTLLPLIVKSSNTYHIVEQVKYYLCAKHVFLTLKGQRDITIFSKP